MKILLLNAGNETGGGMRHLLDLMKAFAERESISCVLGVLEKGKLYEQAQQLPGQVVHFQAGFLLLKKLRKFIDSESITHVHTHGPRANVIMRQISRFIRIPWVVTVHSDPFIDFKDKGIYGKILTKLHLGALKKADHLIAVSNSHCQTLVACGIASHKITLIHNGLDFTDGPRLTGTEAELAEEIRPSLLEGFYEGQLPPASHFPPDAFIIVQVARLEKVKGHEWMLSALQTLRQRAELQAQLLLVGGGAQEQQLRQLVRELDLENYVHFVGEKEDVSPYYKMADVVALSSLSEGFPYVLLEAARFQKPVVATDVGDIRLLLHDPSFGWLVPPADGPSLAAALTEAGKLQETGKLADKGLAFYTAAKKHFSLDKCVEEVYNVYKCLTL